MNNLCSKKFNTFHLLRWSIRIISTTYPRSHHVHTFMSPGISLRKGLTQRCSRHFGIYCLLQMQDLNIQSMHHCDRKWQQISKIKIGYGKRKSWALSQFGKYLLLQSYIPSKIRLNEFDKAYFWLNVYHHYRTFICRKTILHNANIVTNRQGPTITYNIWVCCSMVRN